MHFIFYTIVENSRDYNLIDILKYVYNIEIFVF